MSGADEEAEVYTQWICTTADVCLCSTTGDECCCVRLHGERSGFCVNCVARMHEINFETGEPIAAADGR